MADSALAEDELPLVRRAFAGDREAFYALVSRHQHALYRTILAIVRNPADAEDALQETFLRAYQHLDQFRSEARFQTWLTKIAINTARMRVRKEHAGLWESLDEPLATEEGLLPREVADGRPSPEELLDRGEQQTLVRQALRGLAPMYREVLALRDIQMRSTLETAELLGLSEANVKTRLLRARLQLRDRIEAALRRRRLPEAAGLHDPGKATGSGA